MVEQGQWGFRVRIAVVGLGYVGMANAAALSQQHSVVAVDVDARRVDLVNAHRSPIADPELEAYLANHPVSLTATGSLEEALEGPMLCLSPHLQTMIRRRTTSTHPQLRA
nr:hypothetical protein [Tessaracoccus coleopterorum]